MSFVYFSELPGSPSWTLSQTGFKGTRKLMCKWEQQLIVASLLWGDYTNSGGTLSRPPAIFPFFPDAYVTDLSVAPFEGESPYANDILDQNTGAANYRKAIITATYTTSQSSGWKNAGISVSNGFITFSSTGGAEYMTVPGRNWKWSGGSDKVSEDVSPGILIPTRQISITWNRCPDPPFSQIENCQGKVNSSTFLGYPAECVLFTSDNSNITFKQDDAELWTVQLDFSVRCVDSTYGWNHFLKPGSSWTKIVDDSSNTPYKTANLASMFY